MPSSVFVVVVDVEFLLVHPRVHVPSPLVVPMNPTELTEAMPPRFFQSDILSQTSSAMTRQAAVLSRGVLGFFSARYAQPDFISHDT